MNSSDINQKQKPGNSLETRYSSKTRQKQTNTIQLTKREKKKKGKPGTKEKLAKITQNKQKRETGKLKKVRKYGPRKERKGG